MTTLPSVPQALKALARRTRFHEKVMVGVATILVVSGVVLLLAASFLEGTDRVVTLVGGALFFVLTFLPYNQIQSLRRENLVIRVILTVTHHLREEVAPETLDELTNELLQYSLRR